MRGFTRAEQRAILFLLSTFGLGTAVWWYRAGQPPPEIAPADLAAWENFLRASAVDSIDASRLSHEPVQSTAAPPARIDLNAATYNDLVRLPGIGPVMAKRIIDFRATNGAFKHLPDLRQVKGIGVKTYEKLAPLLMVK